MIRSTVAARCVNVGLMRHKIFISYRRQDAGANALGIGQYLEHEFGRKNVFIDVDMRAGAKFPRVLEERLAECKVMLALIGPDWLNSYDEQGQRRLDDPGDWVRLEIAQALKRDITVIPVRVNDAPLPPKSALPEDIRSLLDHQAASVTLVGFRHEMGGLVRDIRSIQSPRSWRRYGAVAAALVLLLAALVLSQTLIFSKVLESLRLLAFSRSNAETEQNGVWTSKPGEWVMFAADKNPVAYYFQPSTLKILGDRIAYTARYPVLPNGSGSPTTTLTDGVYQDDRTVMDCNKSMATTAERTIYNGKGESIYHYKMPEPDADLTLPIRIGAGSILSMGQHLFCDEQLRTPTFSKEALQGNGFTHLISTPNGDGETYYDKIKDISEGDYTKMTVFVAKLHEDHGLQQFFSGSVRGIAPGYRTFVEPIQLDCKSRKFLPVKFEYYDRENNLVYLGAPIDIQPVEVQGGSPLDALMYIGCGRHFGGIYEGTNNASYKTGATGEQKILINVAQNGQELKVSFQSPGATGEGSGRLSGDRVEAIALHRTEKNCPGTYNASLEFVGDTIKWSYKGEDCGGAMEGHGSATRTKG